MLCQNSGLGNLIDPITSLSMPYDIPFYAIMSCRGNKREVGVEHHKIMGKITYPILHLLDANIVKFDSDKCKFEREHCSENKSCFIVLDRPLNGGNSAGYAKKNSLPQEFVKKSLYQEKVDKELFFEQEIAMKKVINFFREKAVYFSTTGITSRMLYGIEDNDCNFYMQGSMGCVSSIALGVSFSTNKNVIVFDGDGSLLMKMGNLATSGQYGKNNFVHVLFNNGAYVSTGGQPTVSVRFCEIAMASGYKDAQIVFTMDELERYLLSLANVEGPHFVEIPVKIPCKHWPRPQLAPKEITMRFMRNF